MPCLAFQPGGAFLFLFNSLLVSIVVSLILLALSEEKKEGEDWRLVTDEAGEPKGIRIMYGASAPTYDPRSH